MDPQIVKEALDRVRTKLLDLTRRNPLLNFRETKRTLRIIDELPDETFRLLVVEGKTMELLPFEKPEQKEDTCIDTDNQPNTAQLNLLGEPTLTQPKLQGITQRQYWNSSSEESPTKPQLSYELPDPTQSLDPKYSDGRLQTPLIAQQLERRCKTLLRHSRSAIDETGINLLYLTIGFLEWYERSDSNVINRAPLVLIPLSIERSRLDRGTNCYSYVIRYSGEDIETNLSLLEKLDHDFDLILPDVPDDDRIEDYIQNVKRTIETVPRWRVAREMMIGFFSFAKLRIYRDLADESWPNDNPLTDHSIVKTIIAGSESPEKSISLVYGEEYALDDEPEADRIPLIRDADSSQHSAIFDVLIRQKSLVIEGPPGTGKSQTISNLIAGALHEGKTVLFVAEKKAALEVVRHRLDIAGLGDFCLELHSHKTQRGRMHADLTKRLTKRYDDTRTLDHNIQELIRERDRLRAYYDLLNLVPGNTGETIYEILWAADRWQTEIQSPLRFEVTNAIQLHESQIIQSVQVLEDFARLYADLPARVIDSWNGFTPEILLPGDDQDIGDELVTFKRHTEQFTGVLKQKSHEWGLEIGQTLLGFHAFADIRTDPLIGKPDGWHQTVAQALLDSSVVEALTDLSNAIQRRRELQQTVHEVLGNTGKYSIEDLQRIEIATIELINIDFGESTLEELRLVCEQMSLIYRLLKDLSDVADPVHHCLREAPSSLTDFEKILRVDAVLKDSPTKVTLHAHPEQALGICQDLLLKASEQFHFLVQSLASQADYFRIEILPDTELLQELVETFKTSGNWVKRLFSPKYRRANKTLSTFLSNKKIRKNEDLLERLDKLLGLCKEINSYRRNEDYIQVFGPQFEGMKTDWPGLREAIKWSQDLSISLESERCAMHAITDYFQSKEEFSLVSDKLRPLLSKTNEILCGTALSELRTAKLVEIEDKVRLIEPRLKDVLAELSQYHELGQINIKSLKNACQAGIAMQRLAEEVENDKRYSSHFGEVYQGFDTDIQNLQCMEKWIARLANEANLNDDLLEWILQSDTDSRVAEVVSSVERAKEYRKELHSLIKFLSKYGEFDFNIWLGVPIKEASFSHLEKKLNTSVDTSAYLISWSDYCRTRQKAMDQGLMPIIEGYENGTIEKDEVVAQFRFGVYRSLAREIIRSQPKLADFQRATYDNIRERIQDMDKEIQRASTQRIAYCLSKRSVPSGVSSGLVRDYTEFALIAHELSKKKRHIPIRQLVRRTGNALQALKPCFMMSPLSVAQYLVPGQVTFDFVIMDEASQLKLEDSLGAIARSNQAVVVGDPKQLPPTTFFERLHVVEDEEDERTAAEESESILDICQNCFDNRRLRWHYRSEHEALIAFSNKEFYDENLIIFPSPFQKNGKLGIQYNYVAGATYQKSRNLKEAQAVVAAVEEHFRRHPELSLGVATLNLEQRDLVQDELERLTKREDWLEEKIRNTENLEEPFFIKNLENVQGDERDVIFISTTYGPDSGTGNVYQRFGPINSPLGWRRLNVIITRAKKRLHLFTSLKSSDIRVGTGASLGVVALRNYLEYVETGHIPELGEITGREPESDFEIAVGRSLNQNGYHTRYQVGVAGFFIDIGVFHPDRHGEFILGIECDGAAYHSAKSIRDRDILRQQILESKGWKIYRIWSTDWFKNREREVNSLLATLEEVIQADRARVVPREDVIRDTESPYGIEDEDQKQFDERIGPAEADRDLDDELRGALLDFRKQKIEPMTDDVDSSILCDRMIDALVKVKPTTQQEFFGVPVQIRDKLPSDQAHFIHEMLELIDELVG